MKKLQRGMGTRTERYLEEYKPPKPSPNVRLISGIASIITGSLMLGVTFAFPSRFLFIQCFIAGIWFLYGLIIILNHKKYLHKYKEELILASPEVIEGENIDSPEFLKISAQKNKLKTARENFKIIFMFLIALYFSVIAVCGLSYLEIDFFIIFFPIIALTVDGIAALMLFKLKNLSWLSIAVIIKYLIMILLPTFVYVIFEETFSFYLAIMISVGMIAVLIFLIIITRNEHPSINFVNHKSSKDDNGSKYG